MANKLTEERKAEAQRLSEMGYSQREIATQLGVTKNAIHAYLFVGEITEYFCRCCNSGTVSYGEREKYAECSDCGQSYDRLFFESSEGYRASAKPCPDAITRRRLPTPKEETATATEPSARSKLIDQQNKEVLAMLAKGMTTEAIAKAIGLTPGGAYHRIQRARRRNPS